MQITSELRPFPCLFGVAGFKANQLRFCFFDSLKADVLHEFLSKYLKMAREFGKNTSLVCFEKPSAIRPIETYKKRFWTLLKELVNQDSSPWPNHIPEEIDHKDWEFCFNGEPIFVVCNTPAHTLRQSRRSSGFMITFQPRWVFDGILSTKSLANSAFSKVRKRLIPYDFTSIHPDLGLYGTPHIREWKQYFLEDIPSEKEKKCPFKSLVSRNKND